MDLARAESVLRSITSDIERLVKTLAEGKDSRETDFQRMADQGFEFFRFRVAFHVDGNADTRN